MSLFFIGCLANKDVDDIMPEECQIGNYRKLVGDFQDHRYLTYRSERMNSLNSVHELNENHTVGFNNWFRFRLDNNAVRMLETKELEKSFVERQVGIFSDKWPRMAQLFKR